MQILNALGMCALVPGHELDPLPRILHSTGLLGGYGVTL